MSSRLVRSLLLLLLLVPSPVVAQLLVERTPTVSGRVTDALTGEPVSGATVSLLAAADSTVLHTVVIQSDSSATMRLMDGVFSLPMEEKRHYLIQVSHVGYETCYTPFTKKYKRENLTSTLLQIKLKRKARMLQEVTVTGTKIKMVLRGDTVVYNADAFNLAEGSMLDALIRQLPGAELSRSGEITVNGRRVSQLLVDGRDFFQGDPKAALENLPAYTVNKIKVFDRTGHRSQLMGRDMGDNQYVMDVRLKKQYTTGLMGNVEAGGGTDDRYLLKGIASHSRGPARLSVAANVNNLNDQSIGQNGSSTSPDVATSIHTTRKLQVGYSHGEYTSPASVGLNVTGHSDNEHADSWTSGQTYLAGGDTYSRQAVYRHSRSRGISAGSTFNFLPRDMVIGGSADFSYSRGNSQGRQLKAAFDADPAEYGDLLDDLFQNPDRYRRLTLYRQQERSLTRDNSLAASLNASNSMKLMADMVTLTAMISYSHGHNDSYRLTDVNYMKREGQRDFRNNYTDAPTTSFTGNIAAQYDLAIGKRHNLHVDYSYGYSYDQNDHALYRLDQIPGHDSTQIDLLPSTAEALASVLDAQNSHNATRHDHTQKLNLQLRLKPSFLGNGSLELQLPTEWTHKRYDYFRQTAQHLTQNDLTMNPSLNLLMARQIKKKAKEGSPLQRSYMLNGHLAVGLQSQIPDITQMVSYRDDSDPLNVQLSGGDDLKCTRNLYLSGGLSLAGGRQMRTIGLDLSYNRTYDAIATSLLYDKQTGATTTKPVNIDGNWNVRGSLNYGQSFGEKKQWQLRNRLNVGHQHSVDLNSVAGTSQGESSVSTTGLTDNLQLTWRFGKGNELTANGNVTYSHITGSRSDFQAFNTGNLNYGASALISLPWKLQLNTSLTNYSRRGYSDPQMNTDELVWNASLTRQLLKNKLSASIEGFDLLGQLSNRQYAINAQGRTERYTNVLSHYVLLKLTWRFNKFHQKPSI